MRRRISLTCGRTGSRRAASRVASLRPLLWLLAWCSLGTFAFWHGVPWLKGTSVVSPAQAAIAAVGYTTGSEQTYTTGAIQDLQPGDYVLALDSDTGEVTRKRVVQTFRRDSDHLRILTLTGKDGREQTFKTTDEHPFWSADAEAFIDAADLEIGEQVIGPQGEPQQVARTYREEHPEGVPVYNFEVEDVHTYFVQAAGSGTTRGPPVLVHNACSRKLGKNLELDGQLKVRGDHAHHVVPGGKFSKRNWQTQARVRGAQDILTRNHINIDSAANGMWLNGARHAGLHTNDYIKKVFTRLRRVDGTGADNVKAEIQRIIDEINAGTF